jgi:hypothetical protein
MILAAQMEALARRTGAADQEDKADLERRLLE